MKVFARQLAADPDYGAQMGELLRLRSEAIDTANALPAPAADELPGLIDDLLDGNELSQTLADIRLSKAGRAAVEPLLDCLRSGRATWDRSKQNSRKSTAERVVDLVWAAQPRSLGEVIGDQWEHPEYFVATRAIKARAALGRAELAGWMLGVLNDGTREHASMRAKSVAEGVECAVRGGWAEPALVDDLLGWARKTIELRTSASGSATSWAVSFLAQHRPEEAARLFMSPSVLSLDNNHSIHFVLDALAGMKARVPVERLRPMVEKSLASDEWPWEHALPSILGAMAVSDPAAAAAGAEAAMLHEEHSSGVLRLLYKLHDLPQDWATDPPAGMPLTTEERSILQHFSNVIGADGQIGNGGVSQYFFNSSGDHWERDAASFEAIGYPAGGEALRRAAAMFGNGGASIDRGVRVKQYAALPSSVEGVLDEMNGIFWGPPLDAAQYRFMMRHADLFRRVKAARRAAGLDKDE